MNMESWDNKAFLENDDLHAPPCICVIMYIHTMIYSWRSALSFNYVDSRDWTLIVKVDDMCLYSLSYLTHLRNGILYLESRTNLDLSFSVRGRKWKMDAEERIGLREAYLCTEPVIAFTDSSSLTVSALW